MQVKGFDAYEVTCEGKVINTRTGRILKQEVTVYGYARVTLSQNGKLKREYVHRLVALHFIPNPESSKEVNHINGDKLDNRKENLEWVSSAENKQHALKTGLRPQGEKVYNTYLSDELVKNLCSEIEKGLIRSEILKQERFKSIRKCVFDDIRRRRTWKNISKDYKW